MKISKRQLKRIIREEYHRILSESNVLNNLNPTGGIFVEYDPSTRIKPKSVLGPNIITLDHPESMGGNPTDDIQIFRGRDTDQRRNKIVPGDYVTTNRQLARDYAGLGRVAIKWVKKGDVLDDITEPMGEEYIYRPGAFEELYTDQSLEDFDEDYSQTSRSPQGLEDF